MDKKLYQNFRKPVGFGGRAVLKSMNQGHKPLRDWLFSAIDFGASNEILDVGCGSGALIADFVKNTSAEKIDGMDFSEESVKASKKMNKKELGNRVNIYQADITKTDFDNYEYDTITACETVYFWPDVKAAFKEVYRILKPGGRFIIILEECDKASDEMTHIIDGMVIYSKEELTSWLTEEGFSCKCHFADNPHWLMVEASK